MRTTRISRIWDGTRRPWWAGMLRYDITDVVPRAVYMRSIPVRRRPPTIEATSSATGILLPVHTTGRGTPPNAPGYRTDNSPFDRGHLLALSLGGPDEAYNITPQLFTQNRGVATFARKAISRLTWREFEIFAWYCAQVGRDWQSPVLPPGPNDIVTLDVTGWPPVVERLPLDLANPRNAQTLPSPRFAVRWTGTFNWSRGTVGTARIQLSAEWSGRPPPGRNRIEQIADVTFSYQVDFLAARRLERRLANAEERGRRLRRERRDAIRNNAQRLRDRAGLRPPRR